MKQIKSHVSNHFVWQEEYKPEGEKRGNVFLNRTFKLLMKTEEDIKFSLKLSYDNPIAIFKVKIIQGESFLDEKFTFKLGYQYGGIHGEWNWKKECTLSSGEFVADSIFHPNFDKIFLGESMKKAKQVVFRLSIGFDLKKNPPPKFEKLPQKLDKMFVQGNEFSDIKIKCNGKTFDCHKIVLSCQSEVFKGNL